MNGPGTPSTLDIWVAIYLKVVEHLPEVRTRVWIVVLLAPIVAWQIAFFLIGSGNGSRYRRAAIAVGVGGLATLGATLLVRVVELFNSNMHGGPLGWLRELEPSTPWRPVHAVLGLAVPQAAFLILATAVAAARWPLKGRPFHLPLPDVTGVALIVAPLLGLWWSEHTYRPLANPPLLDWASVLPLVCVAFAIWTRAERVAPPKPALPAPPPPAPSLPALDVPALWRSLGAIDASARPLAATPGAQGQAGVDWAERAWHEVGGLGPAPQALEELSAGWSKPGRAFLVGDLPDPTDRTFVAAAALLAVRRDGLTCLIIAEQPARLRDAVAAAFAESKRWPSGPLLQGAAEAREAFAAGKVPAAVFVDAEELSTEIIRALSRGSGGAGSIWCGKLDLVILAGLDRGTPLEATHRVFTLRRLGLALRAADAQWNVLATGWGGHGGRATLEAAFPGLPVNDVAYRARASAAVRVWRVNESFRAAPGDPWERRALTGVLERKLPASIGDPTGALDTTTAQVWGGDVRFVREATLDGVASASALDDAWLLAAYRGLGQRAPLPDGRPHDALWALSSSSVTRFLGRDDNLKNLASTGQLPSPRPLVGYQNRLLQQSHLLAALSEGPQDVESLCGMFDRALVEHAIEGRPAVGAVVRRVPGRDGLARAPLAPRSGRVPDPLRPTVTDQVFRVVNEQGGEVIAEVDAQIAATRFYPGRVFAVGSKRFVVPLNQFDAKRSELRVTPVAADHPLTRAELAIRVEAPVQVQATQEVREGRLVYLLSTFEVTALEEVRGYRQLDKPMAVRNAVVSSRYRTRVRGLFFGGANSAALFHLARSLDEVLVAHLLAGNEDLEVFPVGEGLAPNLPSGVLVIDRYVQGMGAAEALDPQAVSELLKWVRAILQGCRCSRGCAECTPPEVLEAGPDKAGVLRLLGA